MRTRMDRYLTPDHPLCRVYRVGAALFGTGLIVFGGLGFANQLAFLSTNGRQILGLSSNGLLSLISLVVGIVLIAAAVIGGHLSSTVTAGIGVLFLVSGLANLAVLDTPLNLLAFKIQNVLFSLIAGMAMLFVGLYGRVSGGLASDNPYVRARRNEDPLDRHATQRAAEALRQRLAEIDELARAEFAMAEGRATPEQEQRLRADARRRAEQHHREAYEYAAESDRAYAAWLEDRRLNPPPEHFVLWRKRQIRSNN
ncbi:MAG: hypothetical protein QOG46_2312 [Pseudonocardiales bacterium]|nr:hypothetical protein [Pseudonocardiales bacterium]